MVVRKLYFVADHFARHNAKYANGGAELDNETFLRWAEKKGYDFTLLRSNDLHVEDIDPEGNYLVANFYEASDPVLQAIQNIGRYSIWEHDHKYCIKPDRDPSPYRDFVVPAKYLRWVPFYQGASKIFAFSNLHADVVKRNIKAPVEPLGTCFWTDDNFKLLQELSIRPKNNTWAIINSGHPIKNTKGSIETAQRLGLNFNLIQPAEYTNFLTELSQYMGLVFMPLHLETFSRLVAEAMMMKVKVITDTSLLGCTSEPWYLRNSGASLINILQEKRDKALESLLGSVIKWN